MTDEQLNISPRVNRILTSEEAIYGLILVSGMIVASAAANGSAWDAFVAVVVTVIVFFAAHVYAGALGRLAATNGHAGVGASFAAAAKHSSGMVYASLPPLVILLLGASQAIDDTTAQWAALIVNTVLLGALGWIAVARWSTHWAPRILSAVVTAAFGGVLILLKAVVTH
jgi:positive regulator of sigma E activity